MKNLFFKINIFFFLINLSSFSQEIILKGTVLDENENPLYGANIYFEGTTIGTVSNEKGYFELKLTNQINSIFVISYIGYKEVYFKNYTIFKDKIHQVYLQPEIESLNEIIVKNHLFSRKDFLKSFKENFLGEKKFWKECIIVNEDDLIFDYDYNKHTFYAKSYEDLIIRNDYLGYKIIYKLEDFEVKFTSKSLSKSQIIQSFYSGISRFIEINNEKRIIKRREKAYENSTLQFFRWISKNDWSDKSYLLFDGSFNIDPNNYLKINSLNNFYNVSVFKIEKDLKPKNFISELNILYRRKYQSKIIFYTNNFLIDFYGLNNEIENIIFSGDMTKKKISEMLPADYGM
ncbi:carboxypeptidase-like regulatory domain-containing protein [Flavobacterium piscinae]|uniref:Carboxypeptidase-like regulatory domain-containing protein n=1 Tax=Flavobacterium piscinae TaxID=2506424 RepID=A0A4Q1KYG9_9FLAO|nr:carboxypeptidase-like regulatory domain-containing protein [Flavobacterium piscinae]RXR34780.1 carboxypeptidase-like regulatory domain-containing protein [Flavobacterium piscinae]